MPFYKEGIDRGERAFHIVDSAHAEEHRCACRAYGIDVEAAQRSGQLEVAHWEDAYLKDGYFDGERMNRILAGVIEGGRGKFGLTRGMGDMDWALKSAPGVADIVEYESKLNYILPKYPDPIICVYDLNKHSASVVMDIMRTHPMVIVGGVLQENPLYVAPEEFLQELRNRKADKERRSSESAFPITDAGSEMFERVLST